jgi:NAD(P)-dependent dehydrogenase (short-subunit alcohol dehydrogenase family)
MNVPDLFSLQGRVALITGGSQGIGRMIAAGFLAHGAKVYISARNADVCHRAARELSAQGGSCIALPMDVATVEGCKSLAGMLAVREPQLDILVNNAGVFVEAPFDEFPAESWDTVLNLNARAPFFLTQALAPALRKAASADRPAKVINIASIDGIYLTHRNSFSYGTSKAGLIQLTRLMAAQLIRDHVCVSGIAPGPFPSVMNKEAVEQAAKAAAHIPARRLGRPDDMAGAAVFLASRAGDYVVGATITVDGGLTYATQAPRRIDGH